MARLSHSKTLRYRCSGDCWIMSGEERSAGGDSGSDFRRYWLGSAEVSPLRSGGYLYTPSASEGLEVQRRQMTTVPGDNVFNLAVEEFDDCQRIIKPPFLISLSCLMIVSLLPLTRSTGRASLCRSSTILRRRSGWAP